MTDAPQLVGRRHRSGNVPAALARLGRSVHRGLTDPKPRLTIDLTAEQWRTLLAAPQERRDRAVRAAVQAFDDAIRFPH